MTIKEFLEENKDVLDMKITVGAAFDAMLDTVELNRHEWESVFWSLVAEAMTVNDYKYKRYDEECL